jgi:hypothetical protein
MCGGVYYIYDGEVRRVYFPNPAALLPVQQREGDPLLMPWGRREKQSGALPMGGWARLTSIHAGRWDRWFPRPVKIPLLSFMEKDIEGNSHWFDLTTGHWVQGLYIAWEQEHRVYVVTIQPETENRVHERWPRILEG